MTSLLLSNRFAVPPVPAAYVDRALPHQRLEAGAGLPLTLVTAPAGSGKTTAVASWASRAVGRPIAWLSLEPGEATADRFWALVLCCLRQGGDVEQLVDGTTLVIDGFDDPDPVVVADVDRLVRRCGSALRLVLVSRAAPALPLHRYRLADQVLEIGAADLAFTGTEARILLHRWCPRLGPAGMSALLDRTRGWAAGLRLATRSLAGSADPDGAATQVRGTDDDIAGYLRAEVVAGHDELREAAVRLSVLDVLRPGLVEELGGPVAGRWLLGCSGSGLLVEPVAGEPGCHRFQPLLHDLLLADLAGRPVRLGVDLRSRAVGWLEEHGHADEAAALVAARVPAGVAVPAIGTAAAAGLDSPTLQPDELLEPLTAKELEVLAHLSALLSTQEVADAMFVSVNTVRTHVRGILRKLAVARRPDAVRRARALGLVDP